MSKFTFRCQRCGSEYDDQRVALTCCSGKFNVDTYEGEGKIPRDMDTIILSDFEMEDEYYARCFIRYARNARQWDKDRGVDHEFKLTFIQFKSLMKRKTCYYTGVPMNHEYDFNRGRSNNDLTLVKKDRSLSYSKDNIVSCTSSFRSVITTVTGLVKANNTDDLDILIKGLEVLKGDMKESNAN